MTNWNLEENITSLSDSKLLREHGIEMEPDGWWEIINGNKIAFLKGVVLPGDVEYKIALSTEIKTAEYHPAYRLDRLEHKLGKFVEGNTIQERIRQAVKQLVC